MNTKFLFLVFALVLGMTMGCTNDDFDYDDYETRYEYLYNIRDLEYSPDSLLTIMTWNIKLSFGPFRNPWSDDIGGRPITIDSISNFLIEFDPDIVLLQEVPLGRENTIVKEVLDTIAYKMNYNYAFGGHGFNSDGSYPTRAQWGNGILSKYQIKSIENREVFNKGDKWSRRSVLRAEVDVWVSQAVDCYSLHYATDVETVQEFYNQYHNTKSFIDQSFNPIVLGGDFNSSRTADSILGLVNTAPADYDDIDRILVSHEFNPVELYRPIDESINISDHWAGITTIRKK